ncbi:MAG: GatB/YqeY domain-containing protein [Acidobacteriota bacterium]|nr:GatB/YqeY domain-containing protein [Acidobacteriota bacterium]
MTPERTPQERIQGELTAALKARDAARTSTLRLLLTALKNQRIADGAEVDEAGFLKIVRKSVKQRHEAAELYDQGGRGELAAKERAEAEMLQAYLPPAVDEAEIRRAVEAFVAAEGLSGKQAMGAVMKEMVARFAGQADGAAISRIAREVLS